MVVYWYPFAVVCLACAFATFGLASSSAGVSSSNTITNTLFLATVVSSWGISKFANISCDTSSLLFLSYSA